LDNLGLSAAEINEEIAITGDLMKAVANIVDRQLSKAGENYVSAADKAAQKTAELQNRQMEIGRLLLPLKSAWGNLFHTVKIGFADADSVDSRTQGQYYNGRVSSNRAYRCL